MIKDSGKQKENLKILKYLKSDDGFHIGMSEDGELLNSKELALLLKSKSEKITFIIGGVDGLDLSLTNSSSANLSLSKMTLPHHLVKIFLAEQIYRSLSILNNHPYHRE